MPMYSAHKGLFTTEVVVRRTLMRMRVYYL